MITINELINFNFEQGGRNKDWNEHFWKWSDPKSNSSLFINPNNGMTSISNGKNDFKFRKTVNSIDELKSVIDIVFDTKL